MHLHSPLDCICTALYLSGGGVGVGGPPGKLNPMSNIQYLYFIFYTRDPDPAFFHWAIYTTGEKIPKVSVPECKMCGAQIKSTYCTVRGKGGRLTSRAWDEK